MTQTTDPAPITDPEDLKIITLAASARARTGARAGACLRDGDGRTYAGCSVELEHLRLSAVQVVVAMAVASGAAGVEAVAVNGATSADVIITPDERWAIVELAGRPGAELFLITGRSTVIGRERL